MGALTTYCDECYKLDETYNVAKYTYRLPHGDWRDVCAGCMDKLKPTLDDLDLRYNEIPNNVIVKPDYPELSCPKCGAIIDVMIIQTPRL